MFAIKTGMQHAGDTRPEGPRDDNPSREVDLPPTVPHGASPEEQGNRMS